MKKIACSFFVLVFLFCLWGIPSFAADPLEEIEQLKGEVNRLLQKIEELEKRQTETEMKAKEAEKKAIEVEKKTGETEKKFSEVEKKAEEVKKKSLKDRIELGGEARFRIVLDENASTEEGFYGDDQPSEDKKYRDETSFPLRIRLNAHAEVVPDWVDLYARLTMNKRWGAYDTSATDPFNKPNSFESSIGHDMTPRFEQAYMTLTIPYVNGKWYIGRLPGLDGPPQRQAGSIFPRLFIDSEIDGTLIKLNAPETALDSVNLPWTDRLWGTASEPGKAPTLKQYEAKVNDKTGIILGYLKYQENKLQSTDDLEIKADSDAFLAQAQIKVGKDTEIIGDGLIMDDWHMPNTSGFKYDGTHVLDLETNYLLTGAYADTQLFGFQVYGAYYYSHFEIPDFSFKLGGTGTTTNVENQGFPGHIWYAGFNTGDLITQKMQLTVEFADASNAWINPFNYRGFRRKGTVLQPANNYFFDPSGTSTTVGFYPFNAQVWDIYYDYYAWKNVRFRLGYLDFMYTKHDKKDDATYSILGSSKYKHDRWPYVEINLSF
jgi:hypothetical protein